MADQTGELKTSGALLAIIIFILLAYKGWISISTTSIVLFLAMLYGIFSVDSKDKGLFFIVTWVIFLIVMTVFPDYLLQLTWILLSIVIALSASWKNKILVVGFMTLTVIFLGTGVLSFIMFMVIFGFVYACSENIPFGAMMLIPLLAVGWFIGSGYGNFVEQKVDSFSTQLEVTTGISTDGIGSGVNAALNNTWLMLTNPNEWYAQQFIKSGTRDDDATSAALEITKVEALPSVVPQDGDFDVMYELSNKGKEPAQNVRILAKGDEIGEACGKINGKMCGTNCEEGGKDVTPVSCSFAANLKEVQPKDRRFESIPFSAPKCPGTYAVGAKVIYEYSAFGTLGLEMISRDYYKELLRNDKLDFKDTLSTSSAGPFKVTLRTSRQQPIPDQTEESTAAAPEYQKFTIYAGLVNEHEGTASINDIAIFVPDAFDADIGATNCKIKYDGFLTKSMCEAALGVDKSDCGKYYTFSNGEKTKISGNTTAIKPEHLIKLTKAASEYPGYIQYAPKNITGEVEQNNMKYYRCDFKLNTPIERISTFDIRTKVNYTFTYFKQTSVTVQGSATDLGVASPDCKKKLQVSDPTSAEQSVPQTKDAILSSLAKKITSCYLTNTDGWDTDTSKGDETCFSVKVSFKDCKNIITRDELIKKVEEYTKELGSHITIYKNGELDETSQDLTSMETYTGTITFAGAHHIPGASGQINLRMTPTPNDQCFLTVEQLDGRPPAPLPKQPTPKCDLVSYDYITSGCPSGTTSCNGTDGCADMYPKICCK